MGKSSHKYIEVDSTSLIKSYKYLKDNNGIYEKEVITKIEEIQIDCVLLIIYIII